MVELARGGRWVRGSLLGLGIFNVLSALVGMLGLTIGNGVGIPLSYLDGRIFSSYLWPGIILGVIVGGTQLIAVVTQLRKTSHWPFWAAVAGYGMVIWIFVELSILREFSPLHALYAATGLAQLGLVLVHLGLFRPQR